MNFKSIQEILDFAIQREEEAAASYARMREAARDASQKELLGDLENEEKKHRQLLLGLSGLTPDSLAVKPVADMKISDYVVAEPHGADMTFQDLLIVAAQKEQKAVDLYTELRRRVSDTVHMALFDFLIMQEKNHKLKLESEYEKHVLIED